MERDQASFSTGRGVARGEDGRGSLDGSGSDGSGYRDREPPPSYTGKDPEATFQAFERSVKLWEFETDVPRTKRGAKLVRSMQGLARLAVEDKPFDDIACESGVANVMRRLREFFYAPTIEVISLPRARSNMQSMASIALAKRGLRSTLVVWRKLLLACPAKG